MPLQFGLPVALPFWAREDLADEETVSFELAPSAGVRRHVVSGNFIEVPIVITTTLATGGAAGNRQLVLQCFDQDGNTTALIPAATSQGPGSQISYTYAYTVSALGVAGAVYQVMPLPLSPLSPGDAISLIVDSFQVGDAWQSGGLAPRMTALRIPTGPERIVDAGIVTPIPLDRLGIAA